MKYRENAQDTWHELTIKALDSMEIGSIIAFAGDTIPTGWLVCDGSSITQSAYPELYNLIGGTLPDFKGRTLVGKDTAQTEFDTLLETGGSKYIQDHTHQNIELGGNTLSSWSTTGSGGIFDLSSLFQSNQPNNNKVNTGGVNGDEKGNSGNLQPYAVINWIIKATNTTPTMASVVNATNNSTTDTYSCDYVNNMIVSNWDVNNSRGYIKYPDGTAICYGLYNPEGGISIGATSGKAVEISLPITLSNALYSVNLTKYAGGNGFSFVEESANSPAVDKFYIGLWNNSSSGTCYVMGYYWQVVGRWK